MAFGAIAHSALFLPRRAQGVNGAVTLQPPGEVVLLALVGGVHQRRGEDEVRRGAVHGDGDVLQHGHAQQGAHVWVVRVRFEGVPEEDEEVELSLGDERAELLVAPHRSGQQPVHLQPEPAVDELSGGPGAVELMAGEGAQVEAGPLEQVLLLVVVGHERDALAGLHGGGHGLRFHGHAVDHVPG